MPGHRKNVRVCVYVFACTHSNYPSTSRESWSPPVYLKRAPLRRNILVPKPGTVNK